MTDTFIIHHSTPHMYFINRQNRPEYISSLSISCNALKMRTVINNLTKGFSPYSLSWESNMSSSHTLIVSDTHRKSIPICLTSAAALILQ